jgi:DNA-binding beta-propeller fold protein YncE
LALPAGDWTVKGTEDSVLRVFNNLLNNALEAIPAGTSPALGVTVRDDEGQVLVSVRDNGEIYGLRPRPRHGEVHCRKHGRTYLDRGVVGPGHGGYASDSPRVSTRICWVPPKRSGRSVHVHP